MPYDNKNSKKKEGCSAGLFIGSFLRGAVSFLVFVCKALVRFLAFTGLWLPGLYAVFGALLYAFASFNPFSFSTLSAVYLSGFLACAVGCIIILTKNAVVKPAKAIYTGYKHPLWKKIDEPPQPAIENDPPLKNRWDTYKDIKKERALTPPAIPEYIPPNNEISANREPKHAIKEPYTADSSYRSKAKEKLLGTDRPHLEPAVVEYPENFKLFEKAPPQTHKEIVRNSASSVIYDDAPLSDGKNKSMPSIYFSTLEPSVLIHEYNDRFELFKVAKNGRRTLVRTEYK